MYTLLSFNLHFNLPFIPNIIEISQFFLLIYSANFKKIWHVHDYQKAPVIFSPNLINIQPENVRFLNLSLFQGKLNKKSAALTLEMHASDNPSLQSIDTDPTLICSAFKKNRFYMFTRREPDDVKRLENSCHYSLFGVHVQKPLSKLMKFGFDILQNLQLSLKLASVKVTCKSICFCSVVCGCKWLWSPMDHHHQLVLLSQFWYSRSEGTLLSQIEPMFIQNLKEPVLERMFNSLSLVIPVCAL